MTHGFDLELDYGLYTKESREQKKGKNRRRHREGGDKEYKRRKRTQSNMGTRESRESLFRGSSTSFNKDSRQGWRQRDRDRDRDNDSRQSRMRGHNSHSQNKAHISQTKFEMNPPGFSDEHFTTMNNGVVLIMNQSQRDYFRQGAAPNQRGIKLVTMSGLPDNSTKAKVLSMI